jgi:transcriptional regulator with XRE-family HTH domain
LNLIAIGYGKIVQNSFLGLHDIAKEGYDMAMTDEEYSRRLRKLIAESGKRVDQVAYEADISPRSLYLMMEGKTKRPSMKAISGLAKTLGTSANYIMGVDTEGFENNHNGNHRPTYSAQVEELIKLVRDLPEHQMILILDLVRRLLKDL